MVIPSLQSALSWYLLLISKHCYLIFPRAWWWVEFSQTRKWTRILFHPRNTKNWSRSGLFCWRFTFWWKCVRFILPILWLLIIQFSEIQSKAIRWYFFNMIYFHKFNKEKKLINMIFQDWPTFLAFSYRKTVAYDMETTVWHLGKWNCKRSSICGNFSTWKQNWHCLWERYWILNPFL